jgi:hypothetical protein
MTPVAYSIFDDIALKIRGRDTVTKRADELPTAVPATAH